MSLSFDGDQVENVENFTRKLYKIEIILYDSHQNSVWYNQAIEIVKPEEIQVDKVDETELLMEEDEEANEENEQLND